MTNAQRVYGSIDDYLGPAEHRFFGSGFRRAAYAFEDVDATSAGAADAGVHAQISVAYPRDWSKKTADVDLRPHLSTVDTLVLGAQLAELQLVQSFGLDEAQRRAMWIQRVRVKSGTAPQEDLAGIPASGRLRETRAADGDAGGLVSVFECKIGLMQARYEIQHSPALGAVKETVNTPLATVLGPPGDRYYGDGFKLRQQRIEELLVDMTALTANAQVRLETLERRAPTAGLEGSYQPSVSLVDAFVVVLQMAQVLLYELDHVSRRASNTLWMLQTVLETKTPHRPFGLALPARAAIVGKHLLPVRGGQWRNVNIAGAMGAIALRASFAHELPATAALTGVHPT